MLNNLVWQPIPGTLQAEIYPYIRKPDILSSNSCIIRTPEQTILVDIGALPAQTADLSRILHEDPRKRSLPVLIYLTHCHVDHSLQINSFRKSVTTAPVRIAVQEEGAAVLATGDSKRTIAELYGISFPSTRADICLLTGEDLKAGSRRGIELAPDVRLTLRTEEVPADLERPIIRQIASMGGGDELEIYPTPGHSPDSVCIRIGEILFIGDLLAAANPMVAGISGWNRDDYIHTLEEVLWLLDHQPIRFCYPGHGGVIPADKARGILQRLLHKTRHLGAVTEMNAERLFRITDYALELIDEAEEVFSSIAGRLLYVAHVLEQIEENDAAEHCCAVMDMDRIDAYLLDFRNLCLSLDAGKIRRVEFAFGAVHIVEKIKSLFDPRSLGVILPQTLINRGTGLLLDFTGIANGYRNLEEFVPADLNALIDDAVTLWRSNPRLDASIIDYSDDYEKYLAALVCRIGYGPVSRRSEVCFTPLDNPPFVRVAASRFIDTLLGFIEWLDRAGPNIITVAMDIVSGVPTIGITPHGHTGPPSAHHGGKKMESFRRRFHMCGLVLTMEKDGFRLMTAENQGE